METERDELFKRASELYSRCLETNTVTSTPFLTPAEQYDLSRASEHFGWTNMRFFGGGPDCERKVAFFLPAYAAEGGFDPSEYLCAVRATTRFASPGHRDYLGSLMGLGIRREFLGDIYVSGETACFFCLPSVLRHILMNLERVGKSGVKTEQIELDSVPVPVRTGKEIRFSLQSLRLDAVAAGLFGMSRTAAARLIESGQASLNYSVCLKTDAPVAEGDVLSVRGHGKGSIVSCGGTTRKGRIFITAELL